MAVLTQIEQNETISIEQQERIQSILNGDYSLSKETKDRLIDLNKIGKYLNVKWRKIFNLTKNYPIETLSVWSTISSIISEDELKTFDCGIPKLNDALIQYHNKYDTGSGRVFIITKDTKIMGFVICSLVCISAIASSEGMKDIGVSIDYLAVDKSERNKGIGSLLLFLALRLALTIHCILPINGVKLYALEDAVEFYKKYGFTDTRPDGAFDNGQAVLMLFPIQELFDIGIVPFTEVFNTQLGKI